MTSTSINVGLDDGTRLSSRVLRPPGGGHTDIFGGDPEPPRGRRLVTSAANNGCQISEGTNQVRDAAQANGHAAEPAAPEPVAAAPEPVASAPEPVSAAPAPVPSAPKAAPQAAPEPAKARVRVPPGGFSSGLCRRMEAGGGRHARLLSRLLNRLRGEKQYKHKQAVAKSYSFGSTGMSDLTDCDSFNTDMDRVDEDVEDQPPDTGEATTSANDDQLAPNIDLRYSGQYMTPEQLPEFCNQLHKLVQVIRNIQSYANVTAEYPTALTRRLAAEAGEVAALAAEARNARDVVARTRIQRRAVRAQRRQLLQHRAKLRDEETRDLENQVRLSDRKLFKSWDALKDASDPSVFEPLLEEIRNKQMALECLVRLIQSRRSSMRTPAPAPLPPPGHNRHSDREDGARHVAAPRRSAKRRRGARSVPLSSQPSEHDVDEAVNGFVSSGRGGGAVTLTLQGHAPQRILFCAAVRPRT